MILGSVLYFVGDHECPVGQVPCFDRHGCVSKTALCDGQVHCTDKSDEMLCTSRKGMTIVSHQKWLYNVNKKHSITIFSTQFDQIPV